MSKRQTILAAVPLMVASAFFARSSFSGEMIELYHGARALGMGNAYTGLADDEQALYMNPAGLALTQEARFHLLQTDFAASGDIAAAYTAGTRSLSNLASGAGDLTDMVMGKNIYGRAQATSTFLMKNIAVGILLDNQIAVMTQNKALPRVNLGYMTTNGIQAGYGVSIFRHFKRRGEMRIGLAGKVMWRRGGYRVLPTMKLLNMSMNELNHITGSYGRGIGFDAGMLYVYKIMPKLHVQLGTAFTDIGDTNFTGVESSFGSGLPMPVKGNLSSGLAVVYNYGKTKVALSYDYRHILDDTDWRKKNHVGLMVSLPFVSLYGGINQTYYTYGAGVSLLGAEVVGTSYAEELGSHSFQNAERRYAVRMGYSLAL